MMMMTDSSKHMPGVGDACIGDMFPSIASGVSTVPL